MYLKNKREEQKGSPSHSTSDLLQWLVDYSETSSWYFSSSGCCSTAWIWWRGTPTATAPWHTPGRPPARSAWIRWHSTAAPTSATHSWPRLTCRAATPTATTAAALVEAAPLHSYDITTTWAPPPPSWEDSDLALSAVEPLVCCSLPTHPPGQRHPIRKKLGASVAFFSSRSLEKERERGWSHDFWQAMATVRSHPQVTW